MLNVYVIISHYHCSLGEYNESQCAIYFSVTRAHNTAATYGSEYDEPQDVLNETKKSVYTSIELESEKKFENLDKMVIIFRPVCSIIVHLVRCTRAVKYKNVVLL